MEIAGADIPYGEFYEIYNDIFSLNLPAIDVLARVKAAGYRALLLSNTDPERFGFVRRRFPEILFFDYYVLSYELKLLKPDPAIYVEAARRAGCTPSECVFIDDMEENVRGAVEAGLAGIRYLPDTDLAAELRKIGLKRTVLGFLYLPRTWTQAWRERGPSNSQKKIPCQVPSWSFPPSTMRVADEPTRDALTWAGEFPSPWVKGSASGTILFKIMARSALTSGSAFSLTVIPAVVCGTVTTQTPLATPDEATIRSTSAVRSTNSSRALVRISMIFIGASTT